MKFRKDFPRVLFISHNSFSMTLNNGKTFSSIFNGWPKDRIAQLYFQNDVPDFSVCNNFFNITDKDIIFEKKNNIGRKVTESNTNQISKSNTKIHNFARKKPLPIFNFVRNVLWETKKWDNDNLYKWIDEFNPDVIFFVGGGSVFSYKITNKISKKYSIPVFLYYTDDYITPVPTLDLFWWINFVWLRLVLHNTLNNVKTLFVIGEDMANEFSAKLDKPCIPLMNGIEIERYSTIHPETKQQNNNKSQLKLAYFGGLHLNRWKSLSKLVQAIKILSKEESIDIRLNIYTNKIPDKTILSVLDDNPYSIYSGSVNEKEIIEEMNKYNILVHVESFEKKMIQKTRLSISTKIPEYLASGKPILAIGPKEVSSMKYLKKLNISYIINSTEIEMIKNTLMEIINDIDFHNEIGQKGIEIAKFNHSITKNKNIIRQNLSEI